MTIKTKVIIGFISALTVLSLVLIINPAFSKKHIKEPKDLTRQEHQQLAKEKSKPIDNFSEGKKAAKIYNSKNANEVIAKINGEKVLRREFEGLKSAQSPNGQISDYNLFYRILREKVVVQAAKKAGFSATKEEVDDLTDKSFDSAKENIESYKNFEEYLAGWGMTLEEYKEFIKPTYENSIITGKWTESIKLDAKVQTSEEGQEYQNFDEYVEEVIKGLIDDADIKILLAKDIDFPM